MLGVAWFAAALLALQYRNFALGLGLYRALGRGTLRDWASALFLMTATAAFAGQAAWRGMARVSLALSALAAAASATLLVALLVGWRQGLAERAALAPFMAWEFYAGWQLAFRRSR